MVNPTINELEHSDLFWKFWSEPVVFKNKLDPHILNEIIDRINNKIQGYKFKKNNVGGVKNIFINVFDYERKYIIKQIKKIYPWLDSQYVSGEYIIHTTPSRLHIDGHNWNGCFPAKQILIPLEINSETENDGTVFYKQHLIHDQSMGIEWHLIRDSFLRKDFNDFFGDGYSNFNLYDYNGSPIDHHNDITVNSHDIVDNSLKYTKKKWLRGLDFDRVIKWKIGDIISFNPFVLHSGTSFDDTLTKMKTCFRIKIYYPMKNV